MAQRSIIHLELPTRDRDASAVFYQAVFGWQMRHNSRYDYLYFETQDGIHGGFPGPDGQSQREGEPLIYLASEDIEATLAAIEAHGGRCLIPKTEIPGLGWWALFRDPAGNRLGLFTPAPSTSGE
ncbi:MAG: VOC family protein [Thermogemmatispora sp.]|jgi:predicted enzyme related to lactoylglutathione lyase|uniref:Glyoxalase n=1 Tax=Thermogemmatispora aurantia TaxID=2045279 RepID=A0A5J4K7A2_9CHLR|nr:MULTISPECIES: VOC family protein [Thermogemmatispora]MBE3566089.1 VOC family protein [Thermogemmatispora sp.]GER83415.1 glyoxalase [Thermogemmatispora aurantia]